MGQAPNRDCLLSKGPVRCRVHTLGGKQDPSLHFRGSSGWPRGELYGWPSGGRRPLCPPATSAHHAGQPMTGAAELDVTGKHFVACVLALSRSSCSYGSSSCLHTDPGHRHHHQPCFTEEETEAPGGSFIRKTGLGSLTSAQWSHLWPGGGRGGGCGSQVTSHGLSHAGPRVSLHPPGAAIEGRGRRICAPCLAS